MNEIVKNILSNYDSENAGVKSNLYKLLNYGALAGTGKMIILPVDQGFEHGPEKSFAKNPLGYNPEYHFSLAIDAKLNAFAAPIGMLRAGASKFAGQIPLILKVNHSNFYNKSLDQAVIATVEDALELGCIGVGFTIYPGSENFLRMLEELEKIATQARKYGLITVVWSYARGSDLNKDDETAMDVISYAAHMASLVGAHVVKVKLPTNYIKDKSLEKAYSGDLNNLSDRVANIVKSCFDGKRLVVFSGGATKNDTELYEEIVAIKHGGGNGSIIGRNSFQRKKEDAMTLLNNIIDIYKK